MDELRVQANGLSFRCLAAGPPDGPLALLLHGFPEGAESWTRQVGDLAGAGLRAVAPDLRGYGGSDCPESPDEYRMPHLLADVEGLIAALGRERCHLAGHDWGAIVGWSFASYHPDRLLSWSALSVGHPDAFAEAGRDDPDQRRRSQYIKLFRTPQAAERVLAEDGFRRLRAIYTLTDDSFLPDAAAPAPGPGPVPQELIERYVGGLARPGRLTAALNYYRSSMGLAAQREFPPAPRPIVVPSQLIWGDRDVAVGRRGTEATARHVTAPYRLHVLEGAGHWLQFERPQEVSRLLIDLMTGRSQPA